MKEATPNRSTGGRKQIRNGRDELNLAEFPLAAISDYVPAGQKTLVFQDSIWDQGKSETINRRLTISASDAYGLPTALDDEVILGLVQLTKEARFASPRVPFTRYQLIHLLGWRDDGRSYDRIEQSLKRWLGVTLYYDNAFWDNASRSWVDKNFHILEQVTLYDAGPRRRKRQGPDGETSASSFTWNEVVYRSFQAGYLKQLDMDLYRRLRSAVSKRVYRFLDKRFYHRPRWEFVLVEFACEHIGLSRNYDTGQLKRRLDGAIQELEAVGFLKRMDCAKRYVKVSRGDWRIVLERESQDVAKQTKNSDAIGQLGEKLVERGVTASVAAELVGAFPVDRIRLQLEVFDWLVGHNNATVSKNPAGYLVKSIRKNFIAPPAFARSCRTKNRARSGPNRKQPARELDACTPNNGAELAHQSAIDQYWNALSPAEQRKVEQTALAQADRNLADGLERSKRTENSATSEAYRHMIVDKHISRLLGLAEPLQKLA